MPRPSSTRGNVLVIILVAVALFAALGFAVSRSRIDITRSLSMEQAHLTATEVVQYGDAVRVILDKKLSLGGLTDTNAALLTTTAPPVDSVFNTTTGGIAVLSPPTEACAAACAYRFTDQIDVNGVGATGTRDIAMVLSGVKQDVCVMINRLQNTKLPSTPPVAAPLVFAAFDGNYGTGAILSFAAVPFSGLRSFCYNDGTQFVFVHVLRGR